MLRVGDWPIDNGGNAFWIHCDAVGRNDKAEEFCFSDVKFALLELCIKTVIEEALKDLTNMLDVLLMSTVSVNKDVVQIGDTEFVEEFAQDVVNIGLKGCWSVAETKGHDQIFEVTISGAESCFVFIAFSNTHSMKGVTNVHTSELLCISDSVHDLGGEGYRIPIFDGHPVERSVIHTETQTTIWFLNE